ncbi:hypothetical protein [Nonomuraea sp. NPDC049646]|uniref:hypothetical protein n=1 Tax=unclassified Nonomuraea TaxID=2593643 RepID=UPI00379B95EA
MHLAVAVSAILATALHGPPHDDNGAVRLGGNWVTYSSHGQVSRGGTAQGARRASGGTFSGCHSIDGGSISYIECERGPDSKRNIFNAVAPDQPGPGVSPEDLMKEARRLLTPPQPGIVTAPPRGKNGYVGLRQFFWVQPAQWHAISKKVTAGPVWAEVTATPSKLTVQPGAGQKALTCSGPGAPYDHAKSPDDQNLGCTYVFTQSSAGLPGSQYQVKVSVVWTARWVGSGGSGGPVAPITTSTTFPLRIGEAPALVGRGS